MPEGLVYKPKIEKPDKVETPGFGGTTPLPNITAPGEGASRPNNPLARYATGPTPVVTPEATPGVSPASTVSVGGQAAGRAGDLIAAAKAMLGVPYKWGGMSPLGVDCSGFTSIIYKKLGINLPRVSFQQASAGPRVDMKNLQPGDLVFWDNSNRNPGADHVEIYIGNGQVIGAARPGTVVRIRTLSKQDYATAWGASMGLSGGGGGGGSAAPASSSRGGSVDQYLAALRSVESNHNYTAINPSSRASGAYQYIRTTWNNYGGYREAWMAPRHVQDARARQDALNLFKKYGNWEQVAAHHLYPAWARDRGMWNRSPGKPGTNPTVAQYVQRIMGRM